jgi:hypothetical protein
MLAKIRKGMDDAHTDKLDGKISKDFRGRESGDWRMEKH